MAAPVDRESCLGVARRVAARLSSPSSLVSQQHADDPAPSLPSHNSQPVSEITRFCNVVRGSSLSSVDSIRTNDVRADAKQAKEANYRHPDDGRRVWFRAMGESLDYPRLEFERGRAIASGRGAWKPFARLASPEDMSLAVAAVEALDAAMRRCPTCGNGVWWRSADGRWSCRRCGAPPRLQAVSGWCARMRFSRWAAVPARLRGTLARARRVKAMGRR